MNAKAAIDDFSLNILAYWPKVEILEQRWMPPPVVRTG